MTCKECGKEFFESDTYDNDFCDKWCEKRFSDSEYEKKNSSLTVLVGPSRRASKIGSDIVAQTAETYQCHRIAKDPVMMEAICEGRASDKKLNADATQMEQERVRGEDKKWVDKKKGRIKYLTERYKARYGYLP